MPTVPFWSPRSKRRGSGLFTLGQLPMWNTVGAVGFEIKLKKPQPQASAVLSWAVDDILHTKTWNGTSLVDNYWKITDVGTNATEYEAYTVEKMSGTAGTFPAGAAVVNLGQSGAGDVLITSDLSDGPYLEIATHGGEPWTSGGSTGRKPYVRLGQLGGIGDLADQWGLVAGDDLSGASISSSKKYIIASNLGVSLNNVGLTAYQSSVKTAELLSNGNFRLGTDLTASTKKPSFAVFSVAETYNAGSSESFGAGDVLMGKNNGANILWDENGGGTGIGRLKFRGGTTVQAYIDTDGSLVAGAGDVILNANGLVLNAAASASKSSIVWDNSGSTIGRLLAQYDPSTPHGFEMYSNRSIRLAANPGLTSTSSFIADTVVSISPFAVYTPTGTFKAKMGTDGDMQAVGGIYLGRNADPGDGNVAYTGALLSYKNSTEYTGYAFVPLTTPLTSSSWDLDPYSTVGSSTEIVRTVLGWPANVKAVLLEIAVNDSASFPTGGLYMAVGPSSTNWFMHVARPLGGDHVASALGVVPCDNNASIWYRISASGTNTMDIALRCWGYWI